MISELKEALLAAAHNESSNWVWIVYAGGTAFVTGTYGKFRMSQKLLELHLQRLGFYFEKSGYSYHVKL